MLHRNATVLASALVTSVTMAHAQVPAAQPEVGPDGRIAYTAKPFNPMVDDAYTNLGSAVKKASGAK
jgi:hypothetical protein